MKMDPVTARKPKRRTPRTPVEIAMAEAYIVAHTEGATDAQLADVLCVPRHWVGAARKRLGLKRRTGPAPMPGRIATLSHWPNVLEPTQEAYRGAMAEADAMHHARLVAAGRDYAGPL